MSNDDTTTETKIKTCAECGERFLPGFDVFWKDNKGHWFCTPDCIQKYLFNEEIDTLRTSHGALLTALKRAANECRYCDNGFYLKSKLRKPLVKTECVRCKYLRDAITAAEEVAKC